MADFLATQDYDVVVENGDFAQAELSDSVLQIMNFRARTDHFDFVDNFLGADIQRVVGKSNNLQTAAEIELLLNAAFVQDGLVNPASIKISAQPTGISEVTAFVAVTDMFDELGKIITFSVTFDFLTGRVTTTVV